MDQVAEINSKKNVGTISLDFLEALTEKTIDEEHVIRNNNRLTKQYKHILSAYGFKTYHDIYTYVISNEEEELYKSTTPAYQGEGKKDFSKLNRTKRTVMRNGQPMDTYIYEKPEGQDNRTRATNNKPNGGNEEDQGEQAWFHADEMGKAVFGDFLTPLTREQIRDLKGLTKDLESYIGDFEDVPHVIVLVDDEFRPHAVLGMSLSGEHLLYEFVYMSQEIVGLEKRMALELIRMALQIKKGVILNESSNMGVNRLVELMGLELEEELNLYFAEYEDLEENFGDITVA